MPRKGFVRKYLEKKKDIRHQKVFGKHMAKKGHPEIQGSIKAKLQREKFEKKLDKLAKGRTKFRGGTFKLSNHYKDIPKEFENFRLRRGPFMKEIARTPEDLKAFSLYDLHKNREALEELYGEKSVSEMEKNILEGKESLYNYGDKLPARKAIASYKHLLKEAYGLEPQRKSFMSGLTLSASMGTESSSGSSVVSPSERRDSLLKKFGEKFSEGSKKSAKAIASGSKKGASIVAKGTRKGFLKLKELGTENRLTVMKAVEEQVEKEMLEGNRYSKKRTSELKEKVQELYPKTADKIDVESIVAKKEAELRKKDEQRVKRKIKQKLNEGELKTKHITEIKKEHTTQLTHKEVKAIAQRLKERHQNKSKRKMKTKKKTEEASAETLDLATNKKLLKQELRKEKNETKLLNKKEKTAFWAMDKTLKINGKLDESVMQRVRDLNLSKERMKIIKNKVMAKHNRREKKKEILKAPGKAFLKGSESAENFAMERAKASKETFKRAGKVTKNFVEDAEKKDKTPPRASLKRAEGGLSKEGSFVSRVSSILKRKKK